MLHFLESKGHAIQKGLERGAHILERGVQIAGAIKVGVDTARAIAPYLPLMAL
jgi:hypothetical protein